MNDEPEGVLVADYLCTDPACRGFRPDRQHAHLPIAGGPIVGGPVSTTPQSAIDNWGATYEGPPLRPAAELVEPAELVGLSPHGQSRFDQTPIRIGSIDLLREEPRIVVVSAPVRSLISLEVLQRSDDRLLFIRGDRLHLGNDQQGREVIYRVIGWNAGSKALIVARVSPE